MKPRKDWVIGPLHIIRRDYRDDPQYGALVWGTRHERALDIWVNQTLWTFRNRYWG